MTFGEDYSNLENYLKRHGVTEECDFSFNPGLPKRLEEAGFHNLYDLVENIDAVLEMVGTNEEEIIYFREVICIDLKAYSAIPLDFDSRYMFEEATINMIKERYKIPIHEILWV